MDRDFLRQNDTVWLKQDGVLKIRDVEIVFRDQDYVYIRTGLDADDLVVTTNLATVIEGSPLRLKGDAE